MHARFMSLLLFWALIGHALTAAERPHAKTALSSQEGNTDGGSGGVGDGDDDFTDSDSANANETEADSGGGDDYNDYGAENDTVKQTRQRNIDVVKRVGTTYLWGKWEKWSKCAQSCVQVKRRQCIQRIQNDTESEPQDNIFFPEMDDAGPESITGSTSPGCFGMLKRYRLCKDERCRARGHQLRDEQCEVMNKVIYKGKFHTWRSYEREHNECELYCRPIDSDNFVNMFRSVMDGTPCEKPAIYYTHAYRHQAVCVESICRAVHSSGAIRPATTADSQLRCGSVLCQAVSEAFTKAKLNYGYNYVATIPAGAMNLTIKQLARSDNWLALKTTDNTFIINGNNRASESGIFEYNEDVYDYNREVGMVTAKGPLTRPVALLLLVRGLNTGIKYDYTVPVPSAVVSDDDDLQTQWNELGQPLDEVEANNIDGGGTAQAQLARSKERRRRKFSWKLLGFGQCNRSCGPGVQTPIFRCVRDSPTRFYSPKRCAFAEKPVFSEDIYHCNRGLCAAYWRAGDYGECRCADGEMDGTRTRYIKCVQEQITGKIEDVADAQCAVEQKYPDLVETCNCPNHNRRKIYARGPDKPAARVYARLIGGPTVVRPAYNSTAPQRRQSRDDRTADKAGVWLMSSWNECSTECGGGHEHRSIYCDRTAPYTNLCDSHYTPEQKRPCRGGGDEQNADTCRRGIWFTSEWSNCTGDCSNLQRRRISHCLLDGSVANADECEPSKRPSEVSNCTQKEVDHCGAKWHYSVWSECSRSCGEGIQRRYAKCLQFDFKQSTLIDSNKCKYLDREPVYGSCNVQKCDDLTTAVVDTVASESNVSGSGTLADVSGSSSAAASSSEECTDEFANCKRINRQRLCKLPYYKTYCCITCEGYY